MQTIALYARVSTRDQHPEAQLAELRAYANRRGVQVREYVDNGVSGRKGSRQALDAMLEAARRHEVSAVVVASMIPSNFSLSRLLIPYRLERSIGVINCQ